MISQIYFQHNFPQEHSVGMHYGLIAVKGRVDDLKAAFSELWPHYEPVAEASFGSIEDAWPWVKANQKLVSSRDWSMENQSVETYLMRQDGDWAVLLDTMYLLCSDEAALMALSRKFGHCLSFLIESASGCAMFWSCAEGELVRKVESIEGRVNTKGKPLPEEKDLSPYRHEQIQSDDDEDESYLYDEGDEINAYHFYMLESEELQRRFNISPISEARTSAYIVVAMRDRKDYSASLIKTAPEPAAQGTAKPWWKFW